jgi:hypothetical protein
MTTDDHHDKKKEESPEEEPMYYVENGLMVFTRAFHLKRGSCCRSGCRHCPYGFKEESAVGSKQ